MHDTTEAAQALQTAHYRRLTGAQRLVLAFEMSMLTRAFAAARIRREHPGWSEAEIRRELVRLSLLTGDGTRAPR